MIRENRELRCRQRLQQRASKTTGTVIEGEVLTNETLTLPAYREASPKAVNNVWETRYRLIMERLEELAERLSSGEPIALSTLEEQTARLLTGVVMSLRQHNVNKRGQCRFCTAPHLTWRFWRRPPCTVYRNLNFAMNQGLGEVWWQLFDNLGRQISLDETRKWVAKRK